MANIQQLAPELLIQILSLVDTLEDLRSLVLSSSACFRTYSSYQRPIVLSVLRNALPPELLRELFAISNVPQLPCPEPGYTSNSERVRAFHDQYFSDQPFVLPPDPSNANVASLLRTYFTVERLIRIYFQHAYAPFLYVDSNQHPDEERPRFMPLSVAEKTRLRRAFYRYEQYSRVFSQAPFERELRNLFAVEFWQFDSVISRMTPFEVEELSCIHLFLVTITGGFVEDVEDEVFDAVVSCPGARGLDDGPGPDRGSLYDADKVEAYGPRRVKLSTSSSHTSRKRSPSQTPIYPSRYLPSDEIPPEGYLSFSSASLDQYGLDMFRRGFPEQRRPKFIGRLASLGLDFVLQLIDAPSALHRRFLIQSQPLTGLTFLPDALSKTLQEREDDRMSDGDGGDISPPRPRATPREIDVRDGPTADQQRLPQHFFYNRGSLTPYLQIYNSIGDIRWDRLRAIGYLFWDKQRLEGPAAQRTLIMSWNLSSSSHREPVRDINRWFSKRKSVEERLRGVSIPAEDMMRIAKEFGRTV